MQQEEAFIALWMGVPEWAHIHLLHMENKLGNSGGSGGGDSSGSSRGGGACGSRSS